MNMTIKLVAYQTPANKPFQCNYEKGLVIVVPSDHAGKTSKQDMMYYEMIGIKEALLDKLNMQRASIKDITLLEWA